MSQNTHEPELSDAKRTEHAPISRPNSLLGSIIKEPITVFVVLAAAIFALNALSNNDNNDSSNSIEIKQSAIDARILMLEISRGVQASEPQRQEITRALIEEQILLSEAIALGLDDDSRIHDMLAQKMRHVLSGDIIQPNDDELARFYSDNQKLYNVPATVTVDELVFDDSTNPDQATLQLLATSASLETVLSALDEQGSTSDFSAGTLSAASAVDIENIFNAAFSAQVFAADINSWVGPYQSNRGQHWLYLSSQSAAQVLPLEDIVDRVRLDWIAAEEDNRLEQEIQTLKARYAVVVVNDNAE